jgi:hypothetical protein
VNAGAADSSPAPQRRLVLLGASNLARGIASAVAAAEAAWSEPLDLMAALGHGRSYGQTSWVLGRGLPAITTCQLWDDLAARRPLPTSAIITDIGNDLLYGASPEKISAWVKICCQRLAHHGAAISLTAIPLASVARLRPWEFYLFRSILYPPSRATFVETMKAAAALDDSLRGLASDFGARLIEPPAMWYGIDRIHIRRALQAAVWQHFFAPPDQQHELTTPGATLQRFFYLRTLTPYQRWLFGISNGREQPSGRLPSGTLISFY